MEINCGCYICEKWEGKSSISISGKKQRCIWFMAVNAMAKIEDGALGQSVYFCLIHKNNALCGSGVNSLDDKGEDLSKETLKLLESISFDGD